MADVAQFARIFNQRAEVDLAQMLRAAVFAQADAVEGMVATIAETFGSIQRLEANRFQEAHQKVGEAAVRSMSAAFRSLRFRRDVGSYRSGQGRLVGRLGAALANTGEMVRATTTGVSIVNTDFLTAEAAHWHRLNFGAGAGSVEGIIPPQQFPITWDGVVAGVLGLSTQPSEGFTIPFGYWYGGEGAVSPSLSGVGSDRFFPGRARGSRALGIAARGVSPQFKRQTRGIGSRNFLDAGVRRIANELPLAYEQIYIDLWENDRQTLDNAARYTSARVVTPTSQNIRHNFNRANRGNA